MLGVVAAPRAVLLQRDALTIVLLVLLRLIVAPLAVLAGEGYAGAVLCLGHVAPPGGLPGCRAQGRSGSISAHRASPRHASGDTAVLRLCSGGRNRTADTAIMSRLLYL